jgi:hypothetical protein
METIKYKIIDDDNSTTTQPQIINNGNNNTKTHISGEKYQPFAILKKKSIVTENSPINEPPTPPLQESQPPTPPLLEKTTTDVTIENTNVFVNKLKLFVQTRNPKLYILTPCYGGVCHVNYTGCLIKTIELFKTFDFPIQIEFCKNDSLVTRARNNLIAKAMSDVKMTHILFIDSDISWEPIDILKMILDDKPFIGAIYPLKKYEWNKLLKDPLNSYNTNLVQSILQKKNGNYLNQLLTDEEMIQCNLVNYNINYLEQVLKIDNNLAKVKHVATGFMMLHRSVILRMIKQYPETKYKDDVGFLNENENDNAYALFNCGVENFHYYSEDWMFCHKWSKMGNDIYVNVSVNLIHTGVADYKGCLMASLI